MFLQRYLGGFCEYSCYVVDYTHPAAIGLDHADYWLHRPRLFRLSRVEEDLYGCSRGRLIICTQGAARPLPILFVGGAPAKFERPLIGPGSLITGVLLAAALLPVAFFEILRV
jgi:hypothetical protein